MPWFLKTLNETTTEDVQLRLCANWSFSSKEDAPLQLVEQNCLYGDITCIIDDIADSESFSEFQIRNVPDTLSVLWPTCTLIGSSTCNTLSYAIYASTTTYFNSIPYSG